MERKDSKERANLKLSFLDLFPSYEEIDENNEGILIYFQNVDLSCNLTELIKNQEELFVPQQIPNQTIKINLIKSNNPYATGLFAVKNGEQWVTFTYDHKKKQSTNFALSLIDCIKIKFLCKMDYTAATNTINNQLTNTEIQTKNDSLLANILSKPSPKKLYGNFTSKKKNNSHNVNGGNIPEHDSVQTEESKISKILENITPEMKSSNTNNNLNNTTLSSSKITNNPLIRSENLSEFNPLSASSGVIVKETKNKEKTKNVKKVYNNNLNTNNSVNIESKKSSSDIGPSNQKKKNNKNCENFHKEKTKAGNNSLNNIANTIDSKNLNNENNKSKQNLKRNKSKNLMDSKNKTNKKDIKAKTISNNNLNNTNNSTSNGNINNNNQKKINKDFSTKNMGHKKEEKIEKIEKKEKEKEINNDNIENNNVEENLNDNNLPISNNNTFNMTNLSGNKNFDMRNISSKLINYENLEKNNEPLLDDYNDELENLGLDNFSKKLEDFQLLYSDDYIKSIKEEDYSLEIELYIEKLIELITEYHFQIEEKDIEYQLIKNTYQKNIYKYLEINKLIKKLQMLKDDYDLKKNNPKPINDEHDKNYINNLLTNKVEINMFKYLLFSKIEKESKQKKEEIKKILKNLLNKPKHKNIINQNEKIMKWAQANLDKHNQGKDKGKKKGKQEKTQPDNKSRVPNKNEKNDKKKKNMNNSPSKSKNKFSKNTQDEKGKKK